MWVIKWFNIEPERVFSKASSVWKLVKVKNFLNRIKDLGKSRRTGTLGQIRDLLKPAIKLKLKRKLRFPSANFTRKKASSGLNENSEKTKHVKTK